MAKEVEVNGGPLLKEHVMRSPKDVDVEGEERSEQASLSVVRRVVYVLILRGRFGSGGVSRS
jgi:hypothetical protein